MLCYSVYVVKTDNFFNERKIMFREDIKQFSTYDLLEDICLMIDTIEKREQTKSRFDNYSNQNYQDLISKLVETRKQIKQEIH